MMNLVVTTLQIACFAYLAWGGILSVQCATKVRDAEFASHELKAAWESQGDDESSVWAGRRA